LNTFETLTDEREPAVRQFDAFSKIDGGGAGRSKTDDRRMDLAEFQAGFAGVNDHGFVGLQGISSKEEAAEVFKKIDDNGGGIVLLDEWSFFLKNCEIAADTALGKILSADQSGGVGKKEALFANMAKAGVRSGSSSRPLAAATTAGGLKNAPTTTIPARSTTPLKTTAGGAKTFLKRGTGAISAKTTKDKGPARPAVEIQAELKVWLSGKEAVPTEATPNGFGLAVGKTASKELYDLLGVFEPLAAETPEGEKLREDGFVSADPNGAKASAVSFPNCTSQQFSLCSVNL
jgi:hypothetical protein